MTSAAETLIDQYLNEGPKPRKRDKDEKQYIVREKGRDVVVWLRPAGVRKYADKHDGELPKLWKDPRK